MSLRAAIYTRVSDDSSGRARSPEEQEADGRKDCERNTWQVVAVLCDNDQGASRFSKGGERADFEKLKRMMAAHTIDIVVTWESSRLQRDLAAYVEIRDLCRRHRVRWSYNGRLFDLDDADDSFTTGMDALLSEREVEYTSKRVRRALKANADAGRPHGHVLTGYERVYDPRTGALIGQVLDPAWEPVIKQMFQRVAAGESLRGIARWLNDSGHALPMTGGEWTGPRVAGQLRDRPGYLGQRIHKGVITYRDAWPALIDEVTYNRVQAVLTMNGQQSTPTHLPLGDLVGLLHCAPCEGRVDLTSVGRAERQIRVYRCQRGHVARSKHRLEDAVTDEMCERLAQPDALAAFYANDTDLFAVVDELAAVEKQLAEVEQALKERTLSVTMGGRIADDLERQATALRARIDARASPPPAPLMELVGVDARERWQNTQSRKRRIAIAALMADMLLHPVGRGTRAQLGLSYRWAGSEVIYML